MPNLGKPYVSPFRVGNNASGSHGIDEPSAVLQLEDTDGGFLPTRLTTTQRNAIASPANGLVIYNTTSGQLEVYTGSSWSSSGGGGGGSYVSKTGDTMTGALVVDDNLTVSGTTQSGSFIPTSNSVPSFGMYSLTGGVLGFSTNTSEALRIDTTQRVLLNSGNPSINYGSQGRLQVNGTIPSVANVQLGLWAANTNSSALAFVKSRGGVGVNTIVATGDPLGKIEWYAASGSQYILSARIQAIIEGATGPSSTATGLAFATTGASSTTPIERVRISNDGNVYLSGDVTAYAFGTIPVANQVNRITVTGASTGTSPRLRSSGTDSAVGLRISTQSTGSILFETNGPTEAVQFEVSNTTTAVNRFKVAGAITGEAPSLIVTGSDTDVAGQISSKGIGVIELAANSGASTVFRAIPVSGTNVNYVAVSSNTTGLNPRISARGETNVSLDVASRNTGSVDIRTGGGLQLRVSHTASADSYVEATGNTTGSAPKIYSNGSTSDVDFVIGTKGSGNILIRSAMTTSPATQVKIDSTDLSVNYLTLSGAATGSSPAMYTDGLDSDINLILYGKGSTGKIVINTGSNSYSMPNDRGTASYVLTTNGLGAATWQASAGGGSGYYSEEELLGLMMVL